MSIRKVLSAVGPVRKALGFLVVLSAVSGPAYAGAKIQDVPEIDPGAAVSALTLLSGGLMVMTDRRRRAK